MPKLPEDRWIPLPTAIDLVAEQCDCAFEKAREALQSAIGDGVVPLRLEIKEPDREGTPPEEVEQWVEEEYALDDGTTVVWMKPGYDDGTYRKKTVLEGEELDRVVSRLERLATAVAALREGGDTQAADDMDVNWRAFCAVRRLHVPRGALDDWLGTVRHLEIPRGQSTTAHSATVKLRAQARAWLERTAAERGGDWAKDDYFRACNKALGEQLSRRNFEAAWDEARLPEIVRRPGPRPNRIGADF
jgi:hypothetical protein